MRGRPRATATKNDSGPAPVFLSRMQGANLDFTCALSKLALACMYLLRGPLPTGLICSHWSGVPMVLTTSTARIKLAVI